MYEKKIVKNALSGSLVTEPKMNDFNSKLIYEIKYFIETKCFYSINYVCQFLSLLTSHKF